MANSVPASRVTNSKQFTTRYLFLLTAAVAVALVPIAAWHLSGVPLSLWMLVIGVSVVNLRFRVAIWTFALGLTLIATLVLLPTGGQAGPAARKSVCINNMRNISLALLNYESTHGHFPPPFTVDDQGNPLHSWRVLILPFIDEDELYNDIDLDKPWHHPDNLALAHRMPDIYACPAERDFSPRDEYTTAYVAIVGERTVWRRNMLTAKSDIADGLDRTLLILESESHRLHWMSTADPTYEMLGPTNRNGDSLLTGGPHRGVSVATFCNGHFTCFSETDSFTIIRDFATIDGGQQAVEDALAQ